MKRLLRPGRHRLLLPVLAVLCALGLFAWDMPVQQQLRHALFDQFQRWQPRAPADAPVRIVDIDEASLVRLGQWPWPRTRIAELLAIVGRPLAAVVACDILFAEPDRSSPRQAAANWPLTDTLHAALAALPDHDAMLARQLEGTPAVIGFVATDDAARRNAPAPDLKVRFVSAGSADIAAGLQGFAAAVAALPPLQAAAAGNGALNFIPDGDGVVRRVPLALRVGDMPVPTLVGEALRVAAGERNIVLHGEDGGLQGVRIGQRWIPTTPTGELWVHYTAADPGRYVPAWQVLEDPAVRAGLAGRIVLVGSSAQGLLDQRFGPFGPIPGVEIHAQALEQILAGHFLTRPGWARGAEALLLLATGLGIGFYALRARALVAAAACAATLAALAAGGWLAFSRYGLLLDVVSPALGTMLTFVVCSLAHHFVSERRQRWIKAAFERYVSPNRVEYLVRHPETLALGGRRAECSFIFTDLENFTPLIETLEPGRAVALLNAYLDGMIAIVFRHEGTLDRIVGDALVVMFSAPLPQADHPRRALACALEMDAFASRYAAQQQSKGIAFGRTRIGVHAGTVTVGNFGGSTLFDYRALGDAVNAAARLESANKHLGTRMCISAAIRAACPEVPARPVGRLLLKGKTQPLEIFEPLVAELEKDYAPLDRYQEAFAAMQSGTGDARTLFERLTTEYPHDPLARLHRDRLAAGERGDLIVMREK